VVATFDLAIGGGPSMPKIIDILLDEHQNIAKLLLVLEHELQVFDCSRRPDYEKLRNPAVAKRFGDVDAEHGLEARRLRSFARAVDYVLADQEFLRESFHFAVHDFIEYQRQHLQKEERLLFPAAVKALRSDDWGRIRCSTA
jgi:hemerythrin-like domain-containing protein